MSTTHHSTARWFNSPSPLHIPTIPNPNPEAPLEATVDAHLVTLHVEETTPSPNGPIFTVTILNPEPPFIFEGGIRTVTLGVPNVRTLQVGNIYRWRGFSASHIAGLLTIIVQLYTQGPALKLEWNSTLTPAWSSPDTVIHTTQTNQGIETIEPNGWSW